MNRKNIIMAVDVIQKLDLLLLHILFIRLVAWGEWQAFVLVGLLSFLLLWLTNIIKMYNIEQSRIE